MRHRRTDLKSDPSEIFKALSVETRIKIIELLKAQGSLGVKSIAEKLGISPAAVSQHLKILRHTGLVRKERQGYWIPYSINEESMEHCRSMLNEVCRCGCHGHLHFHSHKLKGVSLESLAEYQKKLEAELQQVKKKIASLKEN